MPDIKVANTFQGYHDLLNKRLEYLHKLFHNVLHNQGAMDNLYIHHGIWPVG